MFCADVAQSEAIAQFLCPEPATKTRAGVILPTLQAGKRK
jgi:hypothetical protein